MMVTDDDRADAARYRWLRDFRGEHAICRVDREGDEHKIITGASADEAIDSEIAASGNQPERSVE